MRPGGTVRSAAVPWSGDEGKAAAMRPITRINADEFVLGLRPCEARSAGTQAFPDLVSAIPPSRVIFFLRRIRDLAHRSCVSSIPCCLI